HRYAIIAELAGMVTRWVAAGRPMPESPACHSTSQEWAATIDAILRANGHEGFLVNFEESEQAFDAEYSLMQAVCDEFHGQERSTATTWAELLHGLLRTHFLDVQGQPRTPRSQATIVGQLFRRFLGVEFTVEEGRFVLRCEESENSH